MYLKGKDVVLMASASYLEPNKTFLNVHHIARNIAKHGNRVLFVESLGLKDFPFVGMGLMQKAISRGLSYLKLIFTGPKNPQENIWVIPLIRLPFERFEIIRRINEKIITYYVKKYAKKLLTPKPILWLGLPTYSYLKNKIDNCLCIYHIVDDYKEVPYVNKAFIIAQERKTIKAADLIFTVPPKKIEEIREISDEKTVIYMNNVAEFTLFNKALTEKFELPDDILKIKNLKKPIIGYMGTFVSYKENFKLIEEIATKCPEYNFVIIGSLGYAEVNIKHQKLKILPNVFFLGPKDYHTLYKYFKAFDLAIIPRLVNNLTGGGFPLKYFEFLSAGLPTIITGLGNVSQFSKIARLGGVANTADEFKRRFKYWIELKANDPVEYEHCIKQRIKIAKQNSWDVRMKEFDKIISPMLKP